MLTAFKYPNLSEIINGPNKGKNNYTVQSYGHAFEYYSEEAFGTIGIQYHSDSAGPGAGYDEINVRSSDAAALSSYGFGGLDCNEYVRTTGQG